MNLLATPQGYLCSSYPSSVIENATANIRQYYDTQVLKTNGLTFTTQISFGSNE